MIGVGDGIQHIGPQRQKLHVLCVCVYLGEQPERWGWEGSQRFSDNMNEAPLGELPV